MHNTNLLHSFQCSEQKSLCYFTSPYPQKSSPQNFFRETLLCLPLMHAIPLLIYLVSLLVPEAGPSWLPPLQCQTGLHLRCSQQPRWLHD